MISKIVLKTACLTACLAISVQVFAQSVTSYTAQFKKLNDAALAWDVIKPLKLPESSYAKQAFVKAFGIGYDPSKRPIAKTPALPAGAPKKPAGTTNFTDKEIISWLGQGDVAILSAASALEAANNLDTAIKAFSGAGYPANADYTGLLQTLNGLKDQMTAFAKTSGRPLPPEPMADIPENVTAQWEEVLAKWTDVVTAAGDPAVVNRMLAELKARSRA